MKSGGYNSVYNYFERPLTARAERTDVPPPEGCEAEPPSPRAQVLRDDAMRAEAAEGAAGVATCRGMAGKSAWLGHWLDQESPRNCRRLAPKENGVTERRIFAPESAPDETLALTTKQLKEQQLLERQRQQEQGYQVCVCVCVQADASGESRHYTQGMNLDAQACAHTGRVDGGHTHVGTLTPDISAHASTHAHVHRRRSSPKLSKGPSPASPRTSSPHTMEAGRYRMVRAKATRRPWLVRWPFPSHSKRPTLSA